MQDADGSGAVRDAGADGSGHWGMLTAPGMSTEKETGPSSTGPVAGMVGSLRRGARRGGMGRIGGRCPRPRAGCGRCPPRVSRGVVAGCAACMLLKGRVRVHRHGF